MGEALVCWKCGASLKEVPMPLSRISVCLSCRAELYVCRLCVFFDTRKAESCSEPRADPPKDKQRANFCEFFQPRSNAWQAPDHSLADQARDALHKLFGDKG